MAQRYSRPDGRATIVRATELAEGLFAVYNRRVSYQRLRSTEGDRMKHRDGFAPAGEDEVRALAARHGLQLQGPLSVNELGLDYRIVIGADEKGTRWVLRIPRREDVRQKVHKEAGFLSLLGRRLPFSVPDWQIATPELIAYPMLTDSTALVVTLGEEPRWVIDQASETFASTFAKALATLHAVPVDEARSAGMPVRTPAESRKALAEDIDRVRRELPVSPTLLTRWRRWLHDESYWPDFCVPVHGDLYVGHVLVDASERVTGMIDWSEARVDDPAIDMASHLMVFGEAGLARLLRDYEAVGGRTWPRIAEHVAERVAVYPVSYALFALDTKNEEHLTAARAQLAASE